MAFLPSGLLLWRVYHYASAIELVHGLRLATRHRRPIIWLSTRSERRHELPQGKPNLKAQTTGDAQP